MILEHSTKLQIVLQKNHPSGDKWLKWTDKQTNAAMYWNTTFSKEILQTPVNITAGILFGWNCTPIYCNPVVILLHNYHSFLWILSQSHAHFWLLARKPAVNDITSVDILFTLLTAGVSILASIWKYKVNTTSTVTYS